MKGRAPAGRMRRGDALRLALSVLRAHKLRSFLTLLGIIIGITSIISVISIIHGLNYFVTEQLANFGPNVFVVTRFGIVHNRKKRQLAARRNPPLTMADARALSAGCQTCSAVEVEVHHRVSVRYRDQQTENTDIGGVTARLLEIEPYEIAAGRIFTRSEIESGAHVVFLGKDLVDILFAGRDPIGKGVKIRGVPFRVIGYAKKKGSIFGVSRDNYVKIPITLFFRMFGSRKSVNISVQARSREDFRRAQDECRVILRARHHLRYDEADDFGIMTAEGIAQFWETLTRILFSVAIFVVGISLVVGGIVIMNIMLVSVVERTREIGIRKAVGARQEDILRQFLLESVILSLAGGFVGIAAGWGITQLVSHLTPLPARFPLWAPLLAGAICTAVGIFFGLHPARKAARLDPIEALRAE
ncbi:MAG: FtsX-like permease family protein [Deltaproteobacteria bacterium]|nr:MAG: FtsX-like permease family protein [Deltaproteobacteria bacterium]